MLRNSFYFLLFAFLLQTTTGCTQGVATISSGLFQIDTSNKLILINQNTDDVNAQLQAGTFHKVVLNGNYNLIEPTADFQYNVSYTVTQESSGEQYSLFFTKLPIIHINTEVELVNKEKVYSSFFMSEPNHNITIQPFAGVGLRGNYSFFNYYKKSYKLEFWNDPAGNETKDIQLLDMRNDDDWLLQSLVSEPLRINDKVGYELWNQIDTLYYKDLQPEAYNGVQLRHVELFVNGEYKGIYGLSEKIDRKQLKLKKYKDNAIRGELYKGKENNSAAAFESAPAYSNNLTTWSTYNYIYPKEDEEINWGKLYDYVSFVVNSTEEDFLAQYPQYLKVQNAVNYFIFANLTRAEDNFGNNWFIAKYTTDEPYFIVPWDLDATFGLHWDATYDGIIDDVVKNNLFKRLLTDCSPNGFVEKLKTTWNSLREEVITHPHIMDMFLAHYNYLEENGAYKREELRWGDNTFPPNQLDYGQLDYISDWLEHRIEFLDAYFALDCESLNLTPENIYSLKVYPNPTSDLLTILASQDEAAEIQDAMGNKVMEVQLKKGENQLTLSHLSNGLYFLNTNSGTSLKFAKE